MIKAEALNLEFHKIVQIHASVRQNHMDTQVFINEFEAAQEYIKDNEASHQVFSLLHAKAEHKDTH